MVYPLYTYTYLASSLILIAAASYMFYKIYHGSKSGFAYTLIAFTMLDGAYNFANFLLYTFPHPIYVGEE